MGISLEQQTSGPENTSGLTEEMLAISPVIGRTAFEALVTEASKELGYSSDSEDTAESIRMGVTRLPDGQTVPDN